MSRITVAPASDTVAAAKAASNPTTASGAHTGAGPTPDTPPATSGLLQDSGYTLLARATMAISRGLTLVMISRACGVSAFGDYSLLLSAFAVTSGLGTFGMDQAQLYLAGTRKFARLVLIRNAFALAWACGIAAALALVTVVHALRASIFDTAPESAVWLTAVVLPLALQHNQLVGLVLGHSWFRFYSGVETAKWGLHLAMVAGFAATGRLGVATALLSLYAPIVAAGFVHAVVLCRRDGVPLRGLLKPSLDLHAARASLRYGARAGLLSVLQTLHLRLDVYLVKAFASGPAVGHYALATSVADVILYASRSIGLAVFARRAHQPRMREATVPRIACWIGVSVALAAVAVTLTREFWITTFFGVDYLPCSMAIACRLPGIVAESITVVLVGDLLGRSRPIGAIIASAGVVCLSAMLNVWWIPSGGIAAAATAFSLCSWVRALAIILVHSRRSGVAPASYLMPGLAPPSERSHLPAGAAGAGSPR